ncbi:trimethylamine methyltransferase family protein [Sporomusa sphaeroides]|uniref:Methyltransferase n=1 Tax=Sporomusa sphaeroides DSM 2875 TaxID=1337886 RepID=A0ABM9W9T9_9FIRM|nr:trimethylamine methyltransferase family protein [Sporomusa sphaeroides]OLS54985.1 trimethylamine methyltransferase MttB [Sporomusa sphaeroides DSM 2875]CVK21855.1 Trimethylamine methyltransferase (MTTB) [Sporomusa sphaeroides DSM 2875]
MSVATMTEDLKQIHLATVKILEKTGMKFLHPDVIELLQKNGIKVDGQTAYFTEEQLLEWIGKAPSSFAMYARNSKYDITVGGDNVECFPAYGPPLVLELDGSKRPAQMEDYVRFLKLYQQCDHFNANGGMIVQPADQGIGALLYATLLHSDKCIVTGSGKADEVEALMDMLGIVFGKADLVNKPRATTIVNTNTPLQLDRTMLETLLVFTKYSQPAVIAACAMAGTTAPITLAGTMALHNAEVLAGIAVAQMMNPGTPVVYGTQTTTSDMKSGSIASGSPEGALCYQYGARLAKAYGLPCRGGGAVTDAKSLSIQAGYESMLTLLAAHGAKTNIIIHAAGIVDSYSCISYEKLIADFEIIGMVRRFLKGIEVNEETLAIDVINNVGIAGHFLTQTHTMRHCRKESFLPEISLKGAVTGDPNQEILQNINKKMDKMLAAYARPELPEATVRELKKYLADKGLNQAELDKLG